MTGDRRLQSIRPVLTYSEVCGQYMSAREFIRRIGEWDWRAALVKLSTLASVVANAPGGADGAVARSWTTDVLASASNRPSAFERQVAQRVAQRPEPIAHQAGIHFLQSVLLQHSRESGRVPSDGELALLLLVANDYFSEWHENDEEHSSLEAAVANVARSMIHDRGPDPVAHCLRLPQLLATDLPNALDTFAEGGVWQELLRTAFGRDLSEFLELFVVPTVLIANDWGRGEPPRPPLFVPAEWALETPKTPALLAFVRSISANRNQLKDKLRVRADGLPLGPSPFWRTPFIELEHDRFVCVSPGVLREQLGNAIWGRLLEGADKLDPRAGKTRWLANFGYRFEYWARNAAIAVAQGRRLARQLHLSAQAGTEDEIEDITLVGKGKVALFSAKSRLMREDLLKGATSVRKTIDWLDELLFSSKSQSFRQGALRLLDAKLQRIRNGGFATRGIPANAEIFPVLLTFDELGLDTPPGYKWLGQRLREEQLLVGTKPITVLSAPSYEHFLALCMRRDAFEVLTYKTNEMWRECRFDDLFHQLSPRRSAQEVRLPEAGEQFDALVQRAVQRLFRDKE